MELGSGTRRIDVSLLSPPLRASRYPSWIHFHTWRDQFSQSLLRLLKSPAKSAWLLRLIGRREKHADCPLHGTRSKIPNPDPREDTPTAARCRLLSVPIGCRAASVQAHYVAIAIWTLLLPWNRPLLVKIPDRTPLALERPNSPAQTVNRGRPSLKYLLDPKTW